MKKVSLLCIVLLGTGLVLAQESGAQRADQMGTSVGGAQSAAQLPAGPTERGTFDALGIPGVVIPNGSRFSGEECPTEGFLCGQDKLACGSTQWYFYSDLEFYNNSDPNQVRRVRCEDFPPPNVTNLTNPIGIIGWHGVYVDIASNGCTKAVHSFRIRFYQDTGSGHNAPANPSAPYFEETVTATAIDTGETVTFGSATPAIRWSFTAVLTNTVSLGTGWFSICGIGDPDCYHLWEGAGDGEGNNLFYNWWEQGGTIPGTPYTTFCDLHYCFSRKLVGSCCLDCENGGAGECRAPYAKQTCEQLNGRFFEGGTCAPGEFSPACGLGVGACCNDNGTCTMTTCGACGDYPNVWLGAGVLCTECCTIVPLGATEDEPVCGPGYVDSFNAGCNMPGGPPPCPGDANCDGVIDFDDINPFVDALSGATPCRFENVDMNGDLSIDFDDINPFVDALSAGLPCPTLARTAGWSTITAGTRIYGTSGTFITDGNNVRDTDWYELDATGGFKKLTVKVRAEFDAQLIIMHAGECDVDPNNPNDPNDSWWVQSGSGTACGLSHTDPNSPDITFETNCLPGGIYWLVVSPTTFSGVECGADYWIEATVQNCTPIDVGVCPAGAYQEVDACGAHTLSGCWGDDPNNPVFEELPDYTTAVPFTVCGNTFNYRDDATNFVRDGDWYHIVLHRNATIDWSVTSEVPIMACVFFGYTTVPIPPVGCDGLYFWTAAFFPAGTTPTVFSNGITYGVGTYPFVVSPAIDADNAIFYGYPCAAPEHDYRITFTITDITCPGICGTATPENEPACAPEYVDTYNGGCDAATFASRDVVLGTTGHCGKVGTYTVGGNATVDHDWWKVTLTGTANARLKIGMRSEASVNVEVYSGLDPLNPNCANRTMLDWYKVAACEATVNIYTPCLLNTAGGGTGVYYIRIYTTEINVPCTAIEGNTYKMTVAMDQSGCTLCALTCAAGLDDGCQNDPNDPETNDPCNDPNFPGNAMAYPIGNYPTYGAKQCGRISTFVGAGDSQWVDRDFFAFTMPTGKTKLYIRGKAQFRMTIRLFSTACVAVSDTATLAWDRSCSLSSVQSLAGLTAGTTYWAEIVYGNGLNGLSLKEWFEGLPCAGEPYSAGYNIYEVELAGGT